MAKFKCKQSGNVFEFKHEHDIKTMRTHASYEEVVEQVVQDVGSDEQIPAKRNVGRPKKD
jgi:hypothetical protein